MPCHTPPLTSDPGCGPRQGQRGIHFLFLENDLVSLRFNGNGLKTNKQKKTRGGVLKAGAAVSQRFAYSP